MPTGKELTTEQKTPWEKYCELKGLQSEPEPVLEAEKPRKVKPGKSWEEKLKEINEK